MINVMWKNSERWYGSIGTANEIAEKIGELGNKLPNETQYSLMSVSSQQDLIDYTLKKGIIIGAAIVLSASVLVTKIYRDIKESKDKHHRDQKST